MKRVDFYPLIPIYYGMRDNSTKRGGKIEESTRSRIG
jgi:hypothetical protein